MKARMPLAAIFLAFAAGRGAPGQVVQLPTYQSFSIGTTVVVPDGGAAFLGGVDRAYYFSESRGAPGLGQLPMAGRLFRNGVSGASLGSSRVYATATMIDLRAIDAAVLGQAARQRMAWGRDESIERRAAFLTQHVARQTPPPASGTPAPGGANGRPNGTLAGGRASERTPAWR